MIDALALEGDTLFSQAAVFRCSGCNYTREVSHLRVLRRVDGVERIASCIHAWCDDQARVVLAERVASHDDLVRERAMVAEVRAGTADDDLVEVPTLEWLDEQIQWRSERTSPARCLECGSANIHCERMQVGDSSPTIEHPGCTGRLRATELRYVTGEPKVVVIDAEGNAIR